MTNKQLQDIIEMAGYETRSYSVGVPPAGDVIRFQPLRGIARFYYARPFGFLPRGGLRKYLARKCAFVR